VGETGADMVSDVDTIQTINIGAVSEYAICFLDGPLANALFNSTSLEVGQRIFIGGTYVNPTFTPQMVSLRRQGVYGMLVPGTVTSGDSGGSFQLSNGGLIGYAANGPVTVFTGNDTLFFNLNGLSALSGDSTPVPLITRGLLLEEPNNPGSIGFYAGLVAQPPQSN